jgi:5-methyltetrahydrofolate--homocysteine methyltransferase
MADLKALADAVIKGDQGTAVEITKTALSEGMAAKSVLDEGLIAGMDVVGARFKKNEVYIPEVLIAARAMKMAMEVLEPELVKAGVEPIGKLVIGTVQGDLHDIGKNLVAMMLKGAGFEVIDLGVDVAPEKFVEGVKSSGAHLVGMSALLTTTMPGMEKTIKALQESGTGVKVMVGGAPVTESFAEKIGAQGFAPDAASAVDTAKSLVA